MGSYNPFTLAGKMILVTGASSGIGRQTAIECSRMGADVIITARNEDRLNETLARMSGNSNRMIPCDLTTDEDIEKLVMELPQLDGVVHCAGIGDRTLCKMVKRANISKVMAINFEAPVLLQKTLMKKKLITNGGSVVFIASRAPFDPTIGNALYSASKGAVIAYANVLAREVAPQKTRVNCICPAMVWTELVEKDAQLTGVDYHEAEKQYSLGRYGRPEDVAYLTVYLLSDASCWMTGGSLDITGGGDHL